jgi:outer membrane biosynthesis protein TonB
MYKLGSLSLAAFALACASATTRPTAAQFSWTATGLVIADSAIAAQARPPLNHGFPQYPADARKLGIEADFVTAFVLDTFGRAEMPSVTFVGDAPPSFARSVCRFLQSARFAPARTGGAATRALIAISNTFRLSREEFHNQEITPRALLMRLQEMGVAAGTAQLQSLPHCPTD